MLKSKILRYSTETGKVPEPGEPKYQGTVYGNRVTVYGHNTLIKVINLMLKVLHMLL